MPFTRILRMTPYIAFHVKSKKTSGPVMLYARLSFNSERTGEYITGILVEASQWPELPDFYSGSAAVKVRKAQFAAEHDWIALNMTDPTAEKIKEAWIASKAPKQAPVEPISTPLLVAYGQYVAHRLKVPARRPNAWRPMAKPTQELMQYAGRHLGTYLSRRKLINLTLATIKGDFGYGFIDYLFDEGLCRATVAKYFGHVSKAINHAVRYGLCDVNPLAGITVPSEPPKRIDFFVQDDLDAFNELDLSPALIRTRQWVMLMCHTGLDFYDAVAVASKPDRYLRQTLGGEVLVYQRLKYAHAPQWGECHIPLLPGVRKMLQEAPGWSVPSLASINLNIKKLGEMIGLRFKPSSKDCRKTAALIFLLYFDDVQVVQKVLGHQSIATTQKYYVYLPPELVYRAMKKKSDALNGYRDAA